MPRLRSTRTGSVVNVDDVTAARLGPEYQPVDPKPEPRQRKPRAKAAKTDDE